MALDYLELGTAIKDELKTIGHIVDPVSVKGDAPRRLTTINEEREEDHWQAVAKALVDHLESNFEVTVDIGDVDDYEVASEPHYGSCNDTLLGENVREQIEELLELHCTHLDSLLDPHSQYFYLPGRSGGQTAYGGTGAGDDLTFYTTTNASKGDYVFAEMTVAGFLKNTASGVVTGGNAVTPGEVTDFDEAAQDAVGLILTDSGTIDFTYNDSTPSITAIVIDDSITFAKIQEIATDRLLGRDTTGTGDVEELTASGGLEFTGSGGIQRSALTGDVTASAGSNSTTIANNAVTDAKLRDSAGFSVIGKATTGVGDPADIVAGDETVLGRTSGGNLTFAQVATGQIANDAVTYAIIQDVTATDRLLGRDTAGSGIVEELTVSGGLEFTGTGGIQRSALTGDVTASAGSGSTTIAANAVTDTKLRDSAALSVIGRSANSVGDPADIVAGSDGDVLRRSGTTLGFGSVPSGSISDFDEAAQDAVGNILADSSTIDFTYTDGTPEITATVIQSGLDHGSLNGTSLLDDDHAQYLLLAGRSGGQIAYGGTAASDVLSLSGTSHATHGYVRIGSVGTPNKLTASSSGELFVVGKTEFDALVYCDGGLNVEATGLWVKDDVNQWFGDTMDVALKWETTNNIVHTFLVGLSGSNNMIVCEKADMDTDWNRSDTDPTLYIQSADATSIADYIAFRHNQTNAEIVSGAGGIQLIPTVVSYTAEVDIVATATNDPQLALVVGSTDKAKFWHDSFNGKTVLENSEGEIQIDAHTYVHIGSTGIPGLANSDGDLYVYQDLEVDGAAQFDGAVTFNSTTSGIDHGDLEGSSLLDDDHTQYALLAGRSGGQTLIGSTDADELLSLAGSSYGSGGWGYTRIGTSGTPTRSPTNDGFLYVSGIAEVDGGLWVTGSSYLVGAVYLQSGASSSGLYQKYDAVNATAMHIWGVSGDEVITLVDYANRDKYHDHASQTNPTLFGHSATDPDSDNTQWWSWTHDQTDAVCASGKGDIVFEPYGRDVVVRSSADPALCLYEGATLRLNIEHLTTANLTYIGNYEGAIRLAPYSNVLELAASSDPEISWLQGTTDRASITYNTTDNQFVIASEESASLIRLKPEAGNVYIEGPSAGDVILALWEGSNSVGALWYDYSESELKCEAIADDTVVLQAGTSKLSIDDTSGSEVASLNVHTEITATDTDTTGITEVLQLTHTLSSGTPGDGIGARLNYEVYGYGSALVDAAAIDGLLPQADQNNAGQLDFSVYDTGGSALTRVATLYGPDDQPTLALTEGVDERIKLSYYGPTLVATLEATESSSDLKLKAQNDVHLLPVYGDGIHLGASGYEIETNVWTAADGFVRLHNHNIGHGLTGLVPTTCYGFLQEADRGVADGGGLQVWGVGQDYNEELGSLQLHGVTTDADSPPNEPIVGIYGWTASGTSYTTSDADAIAVRLSGSGPSIAHGLDVYGGTHYGRCVYNRPKGCQIQSTRPTSAAYSVWGGSYSSTTYGGGMTTDSYGDDNTHGTYIRPRTNTTSGDGRCWYIDTYFRIPAANLGPLVYQATIYTWDTTYLLIWAGFTSNAAGLSSADPYTHDVVAFRYYASSSATTWDRYTSGGSDSETSPFGSTVTGAWWHLEIRAFYDHIEYFVNGDHVGTETDNIPDGYMVPCLTVKTLTGASKSLVYARFGAWGP